MSNVVELSIDELKLARIGIRARSQEFEDAPSIVTAKGVVRVIQKWNHCLRALGVPNEIRIIWISFDVDRDDSFLDDPEDFYSRLADNIIWRLRMCEDNRVKSGSK